MRVLVVDDDYYAREATRSLLARDRRTRVWGLSGSNLETRKLLEDAAEQTLPDVVLQDVHMQEGPRAGIHAIEPIREIAPSARILISSMDRSDEVVVEAIVAGADGYVWKNETANAIADAVVETAAGRFVVTSSIAERLVGAMVDLRGHATRILPPSHPYHDLTAAIEETLDLYCVCGMSASEIADELQVSINTVYSRIKSAYQLLNASSREDAFKRLVQRVEREDVRDRRV